MTAYRPPPVRHWRSYGDDKLPTGAEALSEPFSAFPSWFMRIECDRCGKVQMVNETHMRRRNMLDFQPERTLEERIRHRAYELWEQAGRPHGQAEKYWQQARAELEADVSRDQQARHDGQG